MTATHAPDDVVAIADQVRSARARGSALRIVGAGTWLDAGRPCAGAERVNMGALTGIVTYEPGDLTLTAKAGTSLADIERMTAAEGQWLPLQPMGALGGTIGATVATASYGPLASAFGTPRDQVLGCEFVSGTGDVVRAGGRVVKNVAGFDLVRLAIGAWGTLGAITEVTVRLRARPESDHSHAVQLAVGEREESAAAVWRWLRSSEYTPFAAELISSSLARALDVGADACLLVRLGGNGTFVRAAEGDVSSLGGAQRTGADLWQRLAMAEPTQSIVVRLSTLPSRLAALWARASLAAERAGGYAHATMSRGVVRCVFPAPVDPAGESRLRQTMVELVTGCSAVGERLPASMWNVLARARETDALMSGVRRAFDPDGIVNAGILGDIA